MSIRRALFVKPLHPEEDPLSMPGGRFDTFLDWATTIAISLAIAGAAAGFGWLLGMSMMG